MHAELSYSPTLPCPPTPAQPWVPGSQQAHWAECGHVSDCRWLLLPRQAQTAPPAAERDSPIMWQLPSHQRKQDAPHAHTRWQPRPTHTPELDRASLVSSADCAAVSSSHPSMSQTTFSESPLPAPLPLTLNPDLPRAETGVLLQQASSPRKFRDAPRDQTQATGTQGLFLKSFLSLLGCPIPHARPQPSILLPSALSSQERQAWREWVKQVGR